MLRDETSRHNYYLQLKANAIGRDVPKECSEQSLILLGGLALQADYGDSSEQDDSDSEYFRLEDYIPATMRNSWGTTALQACHREYRGMSRADAETHYIRETCALQEALNAHVFRMRMSKTEMGNGSLWFIVYAKGVKVYGEEYPAATYLWPNISKLSFERKKFEIRCGEKRTVLFSGNDDKNKMLFALCKDTHQFSMKIATRLSDAIRREEEESSSLHACYMYSRSLNLPYKNKGDQRISVISSTSSNTTSGIVSDRVHSEDELEIMINTPPAVPVAAPSTESLALAHLLDHPSVSRQTSSVGQVLLADIQDTLAALKTRSSSESTTPEQPQMHDRTARKCSLMDSPNSQHNVGSQSSSTCSTVVVTTDTSLLSLLPVIPTTTELQPRRRASTSSSLALGFSHTAQNSAVSDAPTNTSADLDYSTSSHNEEEAMSGVYTLVHAPPTETSGVYTMSNSELTGQSSELAESESHESSYYGSFQPKSEIDHESAENQDSVDGDFRKRINSEARDFRLRSDSNVSTSGSFRGDGSDPTDKKHVLLSAEELTELIVGRGTYPSRKSVSDNLDSDCDYVTIPLALDGDSYLQGNQDTAPTEDGYEEDEDLLPANPPAPPVRVDSNLQRMYSTTSKSNLKLNEIHPPRMLPPPYNARHEKTGLCGPPVDEIPVIPLRDPPPYPQQPAARMAPALPPHQPSSHAAQIATAPSLPNMSTAATATVKPEEAAARFITTRPHINILKAHTSLLGDNSKPSFAAPTITNLIQSQPSNHHISMPTTNLPIVPYQNMRSNNGSLSVIPNAPPPYPELKQNTPRTCVILPVIKPRQYLPPPPPTLPRQPPPPPPPQLATVYTSQLARSQIELYQQQLYSDVDYVIYPIQDPAVSQQEYLDAKQGSILAALAQSPPPPPYLAYHTGSHHGTWDTTTCKGHAIYRSTPYLHTMAYSTHSRYASTQNLSDSYVQLPGAYSPMYSPSVASLCSSYEPPPPPPLRPRPIPSAISLGATFSRSKSDDNILNSIEASFSALPKIRRLPPPPPPPYDYRKPVKPIHPSIQKPPPVPSGNLIVFYFNYFVLTLGIFYNSSINQTTNACAAIQHVQSFTCVTVYTTISLTVR